MEAFIIAFNEEETIALTLKHYQQFCSKVTLFDNFSTDNTREIAESMGATVKMFGMKGVLSDKEYLKVKNHCWKNSRADWVIVCDSDEILYHPDLVNVLNNEKDATIMKTYGWNIYSEDMPKDTFLEITDGYHDGNYSKSVIFRPDRIKEINYHYGCHNNTPKGEVKYSESILTLFHYRNIGGYERLSNRHAVYRERLSDHNRELGLGIHYMFEEKQRKLEWYEHLKSCGVYVPPGI